MRLIRLTVFILLIVLSACSEEQPIVVDDSPTTIPSTAIPVQAVTSDQVCPDFVQDALSEVDGVCDTTGRNQACYGNAKISINPKSADTELQFQEPGNIVNVAEIDSLRLDPLNLESETWGVALLRLQANLDGTNPGQNVTFLMFGDVELENRSSDATTNINSFYFASGIGDAACASAPESGLIIQTPEGVGKVDLLINEVSISIGSTAYVQAQPNADMIINVVEGQADVTSQGVTEIIDAGNRTTIELDENGIAESPPTPPEPYETEPLRQLPTQNLPRLITITDQALNLGNPSDPADRLVTTGSGAIETEGAVSEFPITIEAGQRLYFDGLESDSGIFWNVYDADDTRMLSLAQAYTDLGAHMFEDTGTYIIKFWGRDATTFGKYSFQVWDAPITRRELTVPANPPENLLSVATGEIETVGVVDEYPITIEAGQRLYFEGTQGDFGLNWNIYDENDNRVLVLAQSSNDLGAHIFEDAGTYIIKVWGRDINIGKYSFQVWDAPIIQRELTVPATVTDEIETIGAVDEFSFTVEAGQQLYFDGIESDFNIFWNVYDADDIRLLVLSQASRDLGAHTFEEAGTYIIKVWGRDNTLGAYTFEVREGDE